MRIYALVVSYQPLTVYLYRTGFARFTHCRYDLEDISNACTLLNNIYISRTFNKCSNIKICGQLWWY